MQKEPFAWARHSKYLSAEPCEVRYKDLAINLIYELVIYGKSLSAGPFRLRLQIWPSTRVFGSTAYALELIEVMVNLFLPDLVRF